jgi:hypothetical protein
MTNPDVFFRPFTDFAEQRDEQEQMHQAEQDEGFEDVVAQRSQPESPGKFWVLVFLHLPLSHIF